MIFQDFLDDIDAGNSQFERDRADGWIVYSVPDYCGSDSARAMYVSNADAIAGRLEAIDSENVRRWGDSVEVRPCQDCGEPTPAALELMRIEDELSDYPILDENGYYELRDEYVDESWEEFADEARELIDGGDADAIQNAVDCYIDVKGMLSAKDDAGVEELARALAERAWAE